MYIHPHSTHTHIAGSQKLCLCANRNRARNEGHKGRDGGEGDSYSYRGAYGEQSPKLPGLPERFQQVYPPCLPAPPGPCRWLQIGSGGSGTVFWREDCLNQRVRTGFQEFVSWDFGDSIPDYIGMS